MPFFETPEPPAEPTPPAPYGPPIWTGPSELVLGTWIPAQQLITKTENVAVALRGLCAYPNGFDVHVSFLGRPPVGPRQGQAFFHALHTGRGPRFGFQFADGRRAGPNLSPMGRDLPKDDAGIPTVPVLMPRGGGGGGSEWKQAFWVWPLPPDGPLKLFFDWPERNIAEIAVTLDGSAVHHGGEQAIELWPSGRQPDPNESAFPAFGGSTQQLLARHAKPPTESEREQRDN